MARCVWRRQEMRTNEIAEQPPIAVTSTPFQRASAQGRVLLGERSGLRVKRVG